MKEKNYLTIKEVSRMLGVTPLTLRNWDKRGKLKACRNPINNYRLYKPDEVKLLLRKIDGSRITKRGKLFLG